MHELPLTNKILETVLRFAEKNNASEVKQINLLIGEMSDIEEKWLNHYFSYISKDTPAFGAKLCIERVKIKWKCENCGHEFLENEIDSPVIECIQCGESKSLKMINGREFLIESIVII